LWFSLSSLFLLSLFNWHIRVHARNLKTRFCVFFPRSFFLLLICQYTILLSSWNLNFTRQYSPVLSHLHWVEPFSRIIWRMYLEIMLTLLTLRINSVKLLPFSALSYLKSVGGFPIFSLRTKKRTGEKNTKTSF
jgi:hypothetical protein